MENLIDRRTMFGKTGKAILGVGALAITGAEIGCAPATQTQLVQWGTFVVNEFAAIEPELQGIGVSGKIITLVSKADQIANTLLKALKSQANSTILEALTELTSANGVIQQIAEEVNLLSNPDVKKFVQGALLVAHITLVEIQSNVHKEVVAAVGVNTAKAIAKATGNIAAVENTERIAKSDIIQNLFDATFKKQEPEKPKEDENDEVVE